MAAGWKLEASNEPAEASSDGTVEGAASGWPKQKMIIQVLGAPAAAAVGEGIEREEVASGSGMWVVQVVTGRRGTKPTNSAVVQEKRSAVICSLTMLPEKERVQIDLLLRRNQKYQKYLRTSMCKSIRNTFVGSEHSVA